MNDRVSSHREILPVPHRGLLWKIFDSIPSENHQRLQTLRHASQVCGSWRTLILSSTSIWGKSIDFEELNQKSENWRTEVIRRTGDSLLHIKSNTFYLGRMERFLVSLITDSWHRIQSLNVVISHRFLHRSNPRSHLFQSPAPYLEYFSVQGINLFGNDYDEEYDDGEDTAPDTYSEKYHTAHFGYQAPSLRQFISIDSLIPSEAPWFSGLRYLECAWKSTATELLNILSSTPHLESLRVKFLLRVIDSYAEALPKESRHGTLVLLPRLTNIRISAESDWRVGVAVLNQLRPAPGYSLDFRVFAADEELSQPDINALKQLLDRFLEQATEDLQEKSITLRIEIYDIWVTTQKKLHFQFASMYSTMPFIACLEGLSASRICFRHVKDLNFVINSFTIPSELDQVIPRFLSSLTSVNYLATDYLTLQYIHNCTTRYPDMVVLRSLEEISFSDMFDFNLQEFEDFLDHRRSLLLSSPIKSIRVTSDFEGNLSSLERFNELVIWWYKWGDRVEYICGSGEAETLDFTPKAVEDDGKCYFMHLFLIISP